MYRSLAQLFSRCLRAIQRREPAQHVRKASHRPALGLVASPTAIQGSFPSVWENKSAMIDRLDEPSLVRICQSVTRKSAHLSASRFELKAPNWEMLVHAVIGIIYISVPREGFARVAPTPLPKKNKLVGVYLRKSTSDAISRRLTSSSSLAIMFRTYPVMWCL